ncbi:alpha-amylase family glycosyl hydrolase [Flavobacterium sinopsychrotolerans]|uniref:Por secretion system C-terminal sorting domain-containing protein n=1 Tax=Flavobacterium sinopsychrotolerans TaxID=604089 RepID=A0A1H8QJC2_9FLAO|nr:alpha-amylase family glycosyl hydrolase [Flavobacterium sinopsychrotolerans]SEO54118.1 Por secretion system C-terminal sorting domain-containing protein [Flavobacterium sinopsychrotolerans]
MKKIILLVSLFFSIIAIGQQQSVVYSVSPATFEETTAITISINGASVNEGVWGVNGNALYIWTWSFDINDANSIDCPTNGIWNASNEANRFTYNSATDTYTKTFTPNVFYNRNGIGKIGFLVKAKDGTGDKKSQDNFVEVGAYQVTLNTPAENGSTIIASGGSLNIAATNTGGNASYVLKANGTTINTNTATSSYAFNHTNITGNQNYELKVTQGTTVITKKFSAIVNPNVVSESMPAGLLDGINYNVVDVSKATLVLDAPFKDFIYVAGSFNNWQPTSSFAMKKDPASGKFWLELTGLVSGTNYTYQYWVVDATPIAGTPSLVKTADPYSTLVLSPNDDPFIPASSYPNLPAYPAGQEREVTVLQTGKTPYVWSSATTNFVKPEKENLVVYELLVRDFDANRTYQDLINKIDYFKNLKINAIELMPVMEYEGNESWGYNTSFHMALDKFYGTSDKLKEFIDLCHQNGIAVILDVALNHAFGRNPMLRMWMNDPDGDGWGSPSTENPYFNTTAMHSYSVGEDFNHQQPRTQNYVQRVIKQWIEEYKIDGFRWDLTKGFTQNCPSDVAGGQDPCTNVKQQDRVEVLQKYASYSWSLDPTHYTIFEHLGNDDEEQLWANYKINETPSKGIMMWGIMTSQYNELSMGYSGNISRMNSSSRGFTSNRLMGYAESHDEERLMYKNLQFGNSTNAAHNVKTLNVALSRMSAIGAVSLLVPGPKMIWHFGELGWENSIFACNNGTVNTSSDATSGDCKLDTKQQPQWVNNWLGDANRSKIYNDWAKMITMKTVEPVFSGTATMSNTSSLYPNIRITNSALASSQLKDVLILANFNVTTQNVATGFPYTGQWYNLMDNTTITVTNVNDPITIPAGEYRIYGNKTAFLAIADYEKSSTIVLYPNPASDYFTLNETTSKVQIFSITGQLVKSFDANKTAGSQFSVSDLNQGLYIVKAFDENNEMKVLKLLKN